MKLTHGNTEILPLHLDERNAHIHCTLLPITPRNKFSYKELFAGSDKNAFSERTIQLHNERALGNGDAEELRLRIADLEE